MTNTDVGYIGFYVAAINFKGVWGFKLYVQATSTKVRFSYLTHTVKVAS